MKTILLSVVAFCLVPTSAFARLDAPLKWKLQRWEYIVMTQAGDEAGTTETRHVQNNVVTVLRGKEEDLPVFEWWRHKDHVKGQYYLMCYHKAPPGTSAWQSFGVRKSDTGFTVLKFHTNDRTVFYDDNSEYKDMTLGRLKELLKEVPFEPDIEKTEYSEHRMVKTRAADVTVKSDPVVVPAMLSDDKPSTLTIEDAHRAFLVFVGQMKEKLEKSDVRQQKTSPPFEGDIFIEALGSWMRPDVLDFCLTLKPVELKREDNSSSAYLFLTAPRRFYEVTGKWDSRYDSDKWVARMERKDGQWQIKSVGALVGKPMPTPLQPTAGEQTIVPPHSVLVALKDKLEQEFQKLDPKPTFEFPEGYEGRSLTVRFKTRDYVVHPRSPMGRFAETTKKQEGPSDQGFLLRAHVQQLGEGNQACVPQVIREPYWNLYLDVYPVKNTQHQLYFCLAYSGGTDGALIDTIKKVAEQLDAGAGSAMIGVLPSGR